MATTKGTTAPPAGRSPYESWRISPLHQRFLVATAARISTTEDWGIYGPLIDRKRQGQPSNQLCLDVTAAAGLHYFNTLTEAELTDQWANFLVNFVARRDPAELGITIDPASLKVPTSKYLKMRFSSWIGDLRSQLEHLANRITLADPDLTQKLRDGVGSTRHNSTVTTTSALNLAIAAGYLRLAAHEDIPWAQTLSAHSPSFTDLINDLEADL